MPIAAMVKISSQVTLSHWPNLGRVDISITMGAFFVLWLRCVVFSVVGCEVVVVVASRRRVKLLKIPILMRYSCAIGNTSTECTRWEAREATKKSKVNWAGWEKLQLWSRTLGHLSFNVLANDLFTSTSYLTHRPPQHNFMPSSLFLLHTQRANSQLPWLSSPVGVSSRSLSLAHRIGSKSRSWSSIFLVMSCSPLWKLDRVWQASCQVCSRVT